MIKRLSPRFVGLAAGLLLVGSLLWTGNLFATPQGQVGEAPEGIRHIYAKMTPEKEAQIEKVKSESKDVPDAKFKKLVDGKHPAVVRIDVNGGNGAVYHGSGTLVATSGQGGIVITNWHVVRDATGEIMARFPDGLVANATVIKVDKTWDLAALVIARPNSEPVMISSTIPKIGDPLTIAGYGRGTYQQSSGRLIQFCAPGMTEPEDILEITTAARSGDSGGPIFAHDGTLAGVLFGSISGTTNGSHSGRVRGFLYSILPQTPPAATATDEQRASLEPEASMNY